MSSDNFTKKLPIGVSGMYTGSTNSEARKRKEEIKSSKKDSIKKTSKNDDYKAYRDYYLATEEAFTLSETVGVTQQQWQDNSNRLKLAEEACAYLESKRNATVTLSKQSIEDYLHTGDVSDEMLESFIKAVTH